MEKLIDKLTYLSLENGLDEIAAIWQRLRREASDGCGRVDVSQTLDRETIRAGHGLFWSEHDKSPGVLFLYSLPHALHEVEGAAHLERELLHEMFAREHQQETSYA